MVLTATDRIAAGDPLICIAITGTFREPLDQMMVPMRWNSAGTTETGFKKKCFPKCDWGRIVPTRKSGAAIEFDGLYYGKKIRTFELLKILERVELHRKPGKG